MLIATGRLILAIRPSVQSAIVRPEATLRKRLDSSEERDQDTETDSFSSWHAVCSSYVRPSWSVRISEMNAMEDDLFPAISPRYSDDTENSIKPRFLHIPFRVNLVYSLVTIAFDETINTGQI